MPKIDTSFNVAEFEREAEKARATKRGYKRQSMTPVREVLEHTSKMVLRYQDSPRMREWIEYLAIEKPGETKEEKDRRRKYKFMELFNAPTGRWSE